MITVARTAAFFRERLIFAKLSALILWAGYAVSIALGDGHGAFNLLGELSCADHLAFYTAARLTREGVSEKAYDYEFVTQYQHDLFEGRWNSLEAYRNPPFYALLYYPTAGWPYPASAWFWTAVGIAALAAGVRLLVRDSRPGGSLCRAATEGGPYESPETVGAALRGGPLNDSLATRHPPESRGQEGFPSYRRVLFWTASFYPVFCALSYGQNTPLSFFVFAATYWLLARRRPFAAGLVAGLLAFKPPLLLGLVVWGLIDIRRLWPCALGVVVTGAALSLGTYPVVPEMWAAFVRTLTSNVGFDNFEQWKMHNPLAFWRLLLPADRWPGLKPLHAPLAAASSLAAVAVFVWLWRKRRDDLPVMFGAAVFLTLLASPHALIYEWALLAVTGILWWPETRREPDRWFLVYGGAWLTMFISSHFAMVQAKVSPVVFQMSVPVLGWVFWWSARWLRRAGGGLADGPAVVGMGGVAPAAAPDEPLPAP